MTEEITRQERIDYAQKRVDELQDQLDQCYDKWTYFLWCDWLDILKEVQSV